MSPNWLFAFILTGLVVGCAPKPQTRHSEAPHLDLDASAAMIESLMNENAQLVTSPQTIKATNEVAEAVAVGTRMYRWLENINASLPKDQKLSFSNANSRRAIPIEDPVVYNAATIRGDLKETLSQLAPEVVAILMGDQPVPSELPNMQIEDFLAQGRRIITLYDLANRWIIMANYREELVVKQQFDVRGYYYLTNLSDVETKLKNFNKLQPIDQLEIRRALIRLCMNDSEWEDVSYAVCETKVRKAEAKGKLLNQFKDTKEAGKKNFENFFKLDPMLTRDDLKWSKKDGIETLRFPFLTPADVEIASYLKTNVEDEFKLPGFKVEIEFTPKPKKNLSFLEFKPGTTPHAEKGKITMDSREPITEVSSQATIRHEFGHLLGFKDCYVEFYDEELAAIVNYQLDTTDIMCSGAGHFKQSHYDRLKAQYQ